MEYLLKLKCRDDGRTFLVNNKEMSYGKARKLTNGTSKEIAYLTIEDLCDGLDCGIADLFEYIPDKGRLIKGLVPLIRDPNMRSIAERLQDKSPEEIEWFMARFDDLEEEYKRKKEEEQRKREGGEGAGG